jgi:hypothetical protein
MSGQPSLKLFALAAAKKAEKNCPLSFASLAHSGFWWCRRCGRIIEGDFSGAFTKCERCGSCYVKYVPGVPA